MNNPFDPKTIGLFLLQDKLGIQLKDVLTKEIKAVTKAESDHINGDNEVINIAKALDEALTKDELLLTYMATVHRCQDIEEELKKVRLNEAFGGGVNLN